MDTRIDRGADTHGTDDISWHDSTLSTCRPAVAAREQHSPDERDDSEQERNIFRGED